MKSAKIPFSRDDDYLNDYVHEALTNLRSTFDVLVTNLLNSVDKKIHSSSQVSLPGARSNTENHFSQYSMLKLSKIKHRIGE